MTAIGTPLPNGTDIAENIGGKAHSRALLMDPAGVDAMGVVGTAPAANTMLGRLKAIADAITDGLIKTISRAGSANSFKAITPSQTVLNPVPWAIFVSTEGTITGEGADGNVETFPVDAKSILPIKFRKITAATATGLKALYE